jgi:hypothetical protein
VDSANKWPPANQGGDGTKNDNYAPGIFEPAVAETKLIKLLREVFGVRNSARTMGPDMKSILDWEESNYQINELNVARYRAKYYGAFYVISRPFLRYAVYDATADPRVREELEKAWAYIQSLPKGRYTILDLPPRVPGIDDRAVRTMIGAQTCVESAIKSTYSFDQYMREHGRLMVTNIFGTAHAYVLNLFFSLSL